MEGGRVAVLVITDVPGRWPALLSLAPQYRLNVVSVLENALAVARARPHDLYIIACDTARPMPIARELRRFDPHTPIVVYDEGPAVTRRGGMPCAPGIECVQSSDALLQSIDRLLRSRAAKDAQATDAEIEATIEELKAQLSEEARQAALLSRRMAASGHGISAAWTEHCARMIRLEAFRRYARSQGSRSGFIRFWQVDAGRARPGDVGAGSGGSGGPEDGDGGPPHAR